MKDYVIFGTGVIFTKHISKIRESVNIIACLDNNEKKHWTKIDNIPIYPVGEIKNLNYEKIILLVNPQNAIEIKNQLCSLGVDASRILFYEHFVAEISGNRYEVYSPKVSIQSTKNKKVCIISTALNYNGGTIAVCNLARVLISAGYDITLVSFEANNELIKELNSDDIKIILYPAILNLLENTISFFDSYDFIIVNTLQMIDCAVKVSKNKKVLWWLHEPSDKYSTIYKNTLALHPEYRNCSFDNISIYAVSSVAKRNFHYYYPDVECRILPCSLPDYIDTGDCKRQDKLIFALIAGFSPLKAQKDFLLAASEIEKKYPDMVEFWLIGNIGSSDYSKEIVNLSKKMISVKIWGLKTQEEIKSLYKEISVVVCPSYEETLSIVTVEGFMNHKTCIVSEETGASAYIQHLGNGLKCKAGDIASIADCMEWCINNRDKLSTIGNNARKIYEENFSMEIQKRNIMKICKLTGGVPDPEIINQKAFINFTGNN